MLVILLATCFILKKMMDFLKNEAAQPVDVDEEPS
jgi:hypothetical protein